MLTYVCNGCKAIAGTLSLTEAGRKGWSTVQAIIPRPCDIDSDTDRPRSDIREYHYCEECTARMIACLEGRLISTVGKNIFKK